jgi:K+ transporter
VPRSGALLSVIPSRIVIVDLSFVAANMMKVFEGGWVPW